MTEQPIKALPPASGIILAGGSSARMGRDKALLSRGEDTVIAHIVSRMRRIVPEIIIVTNNGGYNFPGVREIPDEFKNMGPLGGLHAGLKAASYQQAVAAACDLPFFDSSLALYLLEQLPGFQAAVPQSPTGPEPLYAAYGKSCLEVFESCLHQGIAGIQEIYPLLRINFIPEEKLKAAGDTGKAFFNLNTPEDYARLQKIFK